MSLVDAYCIDCLFGAPGEPTVPTLRIHFRLSFWRSGEGLTSDHIRRVRHVDIALSGSADRQIIDWVPDPDESALPISLDFACVDGDRLVESVQLGYLEQLIQVVPVAAIGRVAPFVVIPPGKSLRIILGPIQLVP